MPITQAAAATKSTRWPRWGLLLAACLGACGTVTPPVVPPSASGPLQPEAASGWVTKPGWSAQRQAVAAAHPLAAQAGLEVLRAGGNALDAAVAAQWVLGVVEPQSSGVGGGAFLLHFDGQTVRAYDGRETAPAAAREDLFLRADGQALPFDDAVVGGLAVGVPGAVAMLELAHQRHGRLPWARLVEPAIALAEHGFAVGPRLHTLLAQDPHLRRDPTAARHFYDAHGQPWPVGHRLRNPVLADTLRRIATDGSAGLLRGPLAQALVDQVRQHPQRPGTLSLDDLRTYRPLERQALCHPLATPARRYRVCGFPPPSSGGLAVGQILGTLAHLLPEVPATNATAPTPGWLHRYTEAARLAFADRAQYVADPDFVPAPGGDWASLLAPAYLQARAGLIGTRAMPQAPAGTPGGSPLAWAPMPEQPERGTSHLSVVDAQGHAVALTTTIESAFGTRQMVGGFLLNNQLTDFSFQPRDASGRPVANRVEPGKRPRSSMAPTLVFDADTGQLVMSTGSPGGAFIIHYTAKVLHGVLQQGLDAQSAIDAPNFGSTGGPLVLEAGRFAPDTVQALRERGHAVREQPLTSGLQALQVLPGGLFGGADPRREGVVAGD